MSRKNVEDIYPLSPLQQGILFHTLLAVEAGVYFVQHHWVVGGPLDVAALQRAFQDVCDRHPILRTAFVWDRRERPMQVVREKVRLPFEVVDLRGLDEAARATRVDDFLAADRARGFELSRAPLMRVSVLRLGDDSARVVWSSHHLLLDGWSTALLTKEVFLLYEAHAHGVAPPRLERPRPYGEYIAWIARQDRAAADAHFRHELSTLGAPTPLGVDHPACAVEGETFGDRRLELPQEVGDQLAAFARRHQITASTVLQAAWGVVLARYSGEEEVVFGVTVSGRSAPLPGVEKMVGLFINTLPIKVESGADRTALSLLATLAAKQTALRDLEHTALVDAHGASGVPRGTPLFESILVVENFPFDDTARSALSDITVRPERTWDRADNPLTLVAAMRRGVLLRATYDRRRFDDAAVERLLGHVASVLSAILTDPQARLRDLPLLADAERRGVLAAFNDTEHAHPQDRLVHELVAAQARITPEAVALSFEGRALTYRELDERADQCAHALRRAGVGPEALVGVYMERSLEMVVALHGVLRAGGAYVPLDPEYPAERIAFMLEDARPQVILTQPHLRGLPEGAPLFHLDPEFAALSRAAAAPLDRGGLGLSSLAYVIYTSGSTGRPKGAMNEHRGILNRLLWMQDAFRLDASDCVLQKTPYSFDVSVWEFFWPLMFGARLVVARPGGHREPRYLLEQIAAERVTTVHFVPSMLAAFLDEIESDPEAGRDRCHSLRRVLCSGEALPAALAARFHASLAGVELHNLYGPTEAAVDVTWQPVPPGAARVPIGKPIHNTRIYLLDAHRQPVPVGVRGELYIGGVQVGRGYLQRPELTSERFLLDPFSTDPDARLYRTGDVARWLPDGAVEYLGRADFQVKLRGFRIELGEIETAILAHAAVREAVVLAREDRPGDARLVAYLVLVSGGDLGGLRDRLTARLPTYMVPTAFVVLPAFPLTASGKVDRKALPAPESALADRVVIPPRTPVEEAIAAIYADVLRLDPARVGAHDGFFELGGHSLRATSALGRLRAAFSIDLPLRALFDAPTVAELAAVVQASLSSGEAPPPPLVAGPRDAEPVLSFAQERLWFLAQLTPDDPSYNVPLSLRLDGPLDVAALERALTEIVRRHEVLRTTIGSEAGRPVPVVHAPAPVALRLLRVDADGARAEAAAEARRPFDLAAALPFRATLLALGDDAHQLLFTMHHIVSDGWSLGVFYRELSALYAGATLPELTIQVRDHAAWQRAFLAGARYDREITWWKQRLAGAPRALDLPADRPRPPVPTHAGARHTFAVDADTTKALKDLSRREAVTPFMTLLAAFDALLHRVTGQTDLLVGSPIAGRTRSEAEGLVGFFVNTLVLRAELAPELPFRDLLQRVKESCLGAFAHQELPFEQLVREIEPHRDPSRSPLFQVSFTLQAEPTAPPDLRGLTVRRAVADGTTAKFDLTLAFFDGPAGLHGLAEYATDLFDASTIERLAGHFLTLLAAAVRAPERRLVDLPLLSAAERDLVVDRWNDTAAEWPEHATIHGLFEAWADRTPDAPALLFRGEAMSYAALDARANQLAHHLAGLGVGPDALVGISLPRSPDAVVALLATLKAGAAWVPLDPSYPRDRLDFMIADAGVAVIFTHAALVDALPAHGARLLCLDAERETIAGRPTARPVVSVDGDDAAYVIYTSGSTGRPKGVVVEHRGLGNVAAVHHRVYGVGPGSRVLQFSSMNFDASVWDTVMALLNGATLVLAPQDDLLPGPDLLRTLRDAAVTNLTVPPSVLAALPHVDLPDLRTVVVAGETCAQDLVDRWQAGRRFFDAYGPTETSICATQAECFAGQRPVIGKPIANVRVHVVDAHLQAAPIGVPGELLIGGVGLARGYLRRPDLTAEKFVASPFRPGDKLYKTGDLCRWLPDGNLDFLGRIDHQVKLRGFRVELGEIDAVLRQHPGVADAVTVLRHDHGEPRIVAYWVPAAPAPASGDLRAHLRDKLLEHMIPSAFVRLEVMPLTPNGKIDRAALPAPAAEVRAHVAPRGPVEEAVAAIFAEVLHLDPAHVGAHDGFFELGGHSLLATQAMARVRASFEADLPLRAIFEEPTPAGLAARIEADRGLLAPAVPLVRAPRDGDLPLSFGQERLWFLDQLEPGDPSYVIPSAVHLRGPLDVAALSLSLTEIVRRHESLRTTFASRAGRAAQIISPPAPVDLPITDLSGTPDPLAAARRAAEAAILAPFDLSRGPLFRAALLRLGPDDHALVITLHHIVSDGWSQAILNREISALYAGAALPDLPLQYADYAAWQRSFLSGDTFDREIAFWTGALAGAPRSLELPADRPRPPVPSHRGDRRPFRFLAAVGDALEALARKEGATMFMTLLAAFEVLLHRTTGETDLVVGTPVAGRARAETEGMIGFFINNLVLRVEVTPALTFRELLRRVRGACLAAYAHQDVPFERLVQELAPERDLSRSPLFQVMFTVQNEPRDALALAGLSVGRLRADAPTAKLDLSLAMHAGAGTLGGVVEYATDLFDADTIDRFIGHLGVLLEGVARDPDAAVAMLPILPEEERHLVVEAWNATAAPWPEGATIHDLFEAHATRDPEAPALVFEGRVTTYGDLDARANRLANHLRRYGVGPESLVGISMRRSPELIVAVLATLKAGGAWVPLDPAYPADRLAFMIADADLRLIVTEEGVAPTLPAPGLHLVRVDADAAAIARESAALPSSGVTYANKAYVIYTSGSTGRPKGVIVDHHGLGNVAAVHHRAFGVAPGTRVLQLSSINFDASVWDIVMALLNGAALVLATQDALLPGPDLLRTLRDNRVSIMTVPPSVLAALPHAELPDLQTIVVAGEACAQDLVDRWQPGRRFFDAYGPTEASICATMGECFAGQQRPTIGKPIANVQVFVLDEGGSPAPIGAPGELYVGGAGVARGYLRRPELTAEKFVSSPIAPSGRLYRTGDLARWLADGNLEFLGRIDDQVKLRGFRIELGEIDAVLRLHSGVADAVTLLRKDHGDARLVGYYVPAASAPTPAELRAHLREKLPEHMIPSVLVALAAMPLTPNGKIDRRALPAPEAEARPFVAPRGPVEEGVAAIFADVLGVAEVGAHDGFFDLGGHSLLATQAIARVRDAFGADLPLRALFDDGSPAGLAAAIQAQLAEGRGLATPPLSRAPEGRRVLSFAQERLWFLDQLEGGSAAYVVPLALRLEGPLDAGALARALTEIVRRHEVLRTTFDNDAGRSVIVVHPAAPLPLPVTALAGLAAADRDTAACRVIAEECALPIRLHEGPVFRARLLAFAEDDHALVITMHHVVADAWSLGVLFRELSALYQAFAAGRTSPLPDLALQYADFAAWQRASLQGEALEAQLAHWRETLAGMPASLDLPTDRPRPPVMTYAGSMRHALVPADVLARLQELSRREGATLFMTLLAAFDVLLARYTGQGDIVIGTPVAGRGRAETEPLVGFFVNTLVLRARVDEDEPFTALLRRVKETCLGAYAHQDTPFERLVQELDPARDPSRSPLFQVLFSLQNAPRSALALPGLSARSIGAEGTTSKYDLTLALGETSRGLAATLEYRTDLFDAATIDRLLGHLGVLLATVAAEPDEPVSEIPLLTEPERRQILVTWNDTAEALSVACVHDLVAAQAARTPDAVAVTSPAGALSYGELSARSNRLARHLRTLGVGPDSLVGLCLRRTPDLLVGILGVLAAGGAYVPLDPSYPMDRLAFILADTATPFVVAEDAVLGALPEGTRTLRLDADRAAIDACSADPLGPIASPSDLAYVIYTSGSTGRPKGVLVEHGGLTNYLLWACRAYDIASGRGAPLHSSVAFDLTVTGLFGPLLVGKTVELLAEEAEIEALASALADRGGYSVVKITPAHLEVLNALVPAEKAAHAASVFVMGGDSLTPEMVAFWAEHAPGTRMLNEYGPTETVVGCSLYDALTPGARPGAVLPIGKPIANTRMIVLDARRRLLPVGVPGELYIGGAQVARGYLNRPELTAERFIADPFLPGGRLYRSGDLARFLPDGNLEFCGRVDHQVKIRGYRIELGEIEAALAQQPGVGDLVVIAREDQPGDKRLVAYFVPAAEPAPSAAELRGALAAHLPAYMVPSAFVTLPAIPLTSNGKVDRAALPAPEVGSSAAEAVPPRDPVEEVIAGIWAEILGAERVGAHDDFFELGGHSLLATQVMGRMVGALGVELPLSALFEAPTVARLAERVSAALAAGHGVAAPPIVPVPRNGDLAVSFAQERLWFLDQLEPGDPSYLVPSALRLRGPLDAAALARALTEIVRRHEVLRTSFRLSAGKPVGVIHEPRPVEIPLTRWPALSAEEREEAARREVAAEARRPFDLAVAPLLRARLFALGDDDHVLSLTMHHVVSDAWTEAVFHRELAALYEAFVAGLPSPLPELAVQYADYAAWQRAFLHGDVLDQQLAFWKQALAGAPAALDLPTDRPRPPVPTHAGGRRTVAFPAELLRALQDLSRKEGVTLFMTLLAAFEVLLARLTGQPDVVLGSPIAGRTRAETEPLLGFFINTLVLRAKVDGDRSFRDLLRAARAACLVAYAHQDMPFERLVQELAPERDLSRTPLFQVMFALQNAGGSGPSLPGLDVRGFGADTAAAKFDLTLVMGESRGNLVASMEYAADLFDASTVDRWLSHLGTLLRAAIADPDAKLADLPLLGDAELRALTVDWNEPARQFAPCDVIPDRFEAHVDRAPDAPAVTFDGATLTYRELDERSNRLAHALQKRGVGPETLVGLAVERSLDTIVGILGILKAGGAYLPLDPDYPKDRLAFMIADSRVSLVVTQDEVAAALPEHGAALLRLDTDAAVLAAEPSTRPTRAITPASLAYVIYTSGSTGKPKGAMVTHHNVARLFEATEHWYDFGASDVWTMFHSYAFDFSVWEIWGALFYGGGVVVVPYWISRAPDAFYQLLADEGVTVLNQTPSAFRQLVHHDGTAAPALRERLRLRYVVFGGEALDIGDLGPWWDRHDDAKPRLVNMYGITETTVHVTYRALSRADLERSWSSVIGRPIPDLTVYILDAQRRPVPIGVAGEMFVGGAGVSRGYLDRPELTAERFLADPFREGDRLYKTGDLARHLANGDVEYLGRIDHQVKIRGFRIELGEIETVLDQHPAVRESVVLARQDGPGEKRLAAYLVCFDGPRPTAIELRSFLKQKLPEMMVPAAFVLLDAMPLTENGKIDRRALPAPEEGERAELGAEFVAPTSAVEEELSSIWASVLRLPKVGVHDNFFEIGGDSILSIQIVARAQQANIFITPRQLFQHPTVADLATVAGTTQQAKAEQGPVTGAAPLTPIQRWWLEQEVADPHHWNQAFFLEVREPVEPAALHEAVAALLDHHDALRLRLAGGKQSIAAPGGRPPVRVVDLTTVADADLTAAIGPLTSEAQQCLDLESGPICRVILFDLGPARPSRLLLVIHHLAVDGVSWRILLDDLWTAYGQRRRGEAIALPPKTTSFKHWGERLVEHAATIEHERHDWLAPARAHVAPLPIDREAGENTENSARNLVVSLTPEETELLLRKVPEAYQTQINDALLAAFARAWEAHTGSAACVLDLEGHGREELFADVDLTRTVGWFTALYPMLLELPPGGPGATIKAIKEQIRAVPGRGVGYGLLRYLVGDAELAALPAADISFNYLGQLDQALPDDAPFRFAREPSGPSHSPRARRRYLLDVTASVSHGRLSIQWTYSEACHLRATIEALAERYLTALRALIDHCLSPEAGGYTPSDFQEQGLTQDVIDMLAGLDDEADDEADA